MITRWRDRGCGRGAGVELDRRVAHESDRHDLGRGVHLGHDPSGSVTETITLPTSASRIRSTLPTGTPEIFTTELALRLPAVLNWIFQNSSSSAPIDLPLSQLVPTTNSTIARITRLPTVTSLL